MPSLTLGRGLTGHARAERDDGDNERADLTYVTRN